MLFWWHYNNKIKYFFIQQFIWGKKSSFALWNCVIFLNMRGHSSPPAWLQPSTFIPIVWAKHIPLYHCVYAVSCQLFPASTSSLGLLSNKCVSTYNYKAVGEKKTTVRLYAASIRNSCECRYIIFLYENKIMKKLPFVTISKKTASKSLYYITDITE